MKTKNKTQFKVGVIILAAGMGKRMHSNIPKVLTETAGIPIVLRVLREIQKALPGEQVAIVTGVHKKAIQSVVESDLSLDQAVISYVDQLSPLGTGDAVRSAVQSSWAKMNAFTHFLILPGDVPLVTERLIGEMSKPLNLKLSCRLLTCQLGDPSGYGRVVRRKGSGLKVVEERDASAEEKLINEVVVSIYLFAGKFLSSAVKKLTTRNAQKEYYLTEVFDLAAQQKVKLETLFWSNFDDVRGVNNPWELGQANEILNLRIVRKWALSGVYFEDPGSVLIGDEVTIEVGVRISRGVILGGKTAIGQNAILGPYVHLQNVRVGESAQLKTGTVAEDSIIERQATLGPYAHLRPKSLVGKNVKIGNFVELKNTQVAENTSVAHLSYLGDATIGKNVNIGCGFITCNFDGRLIDGRRKHPTLIEDDVFLGSDCQVVAPIKIGRGAYVASGSTLTEDVEAGALAIARSRQVIKKGYAKKLKGS